MILVKPSINLFKSRKGSFLDRFMKWALTIGRIVVILTEAIALSAFLYRFVLDQQLIDIHGKIKQKQALVKLLKNNEDTFRNLQDRLSLISEITNSGKQTITLFSDIVNFPSSDISFNNVFLSENQIKINANVQSVSTLTNFIKTLKENPKIQSVSLDKIENRTKSATIIVSVTAITKIKGGENK
ncbi:MAG: hypothetical protein HYV37_00910 [Candidatus Levyibacteriota bacterium]|nr:MAG: hypothetical protein HYV37_00910 [Candidatus Levybacteria bacterium]